MSTLGVPPTASSDSGSGAAQTFRKSPLLPLFLTVLVDVLALSIMLPLLPFLAQKYGASPFVADLLFTVFSLCQFISGPILGRISDRVGRKPTLLVSQLGTFAGLVLLAYADRLELLFVARIIDGLTAGNLSIAQAYITDVTRPENRTKAFGLIGMAFGIGFLIGPALSGYLAKNVSYSAPPMIAAGLSLLSVLLTITLLPPNKPIDAGSRPSRSELFRRYFSRGPTRARLLEMFAFIFSFSTLTSGLALVLAKRMGFDIDRVAYFFAYSGIVGGLVQGGLGRAAKKLGEHRLSVFGLVMMIAGYVVLAVSDTTTLLLIALGVGSIGSSVVRPALTTMLTKTVSPSEQGLALGINQASNSIALVVAPIIGGLLITRGWYAAWALVAAGAAALSIVIRSVSGVGAEFVEQAPKEPEKTAGAENETREPSRV